MGMPAGSKFDARIPSVAREMAMQLYASLSVCNPKTTAELAKKVGCNVPQARAALRHLRKEGKAWAQGDKKTRVWLKVRKPK